MSELDVRCSTVAQLATRYLEGALSPIEQTSYETHLVICDSCVIFLDDIRHLSTRLHELHTDPLADEDRRAMLEATRE